MTFDDWLFFAHIAGAAIWLGSGVVLALLSSHANKTGQQGRMIQQMEWIGPRVGGPVSLLIPVTGVWMVLRNESFEFSEVWILVGIILFVILFAVGIGFHGPNYKRIASAGEGSSTRSRLIQRSFAAARLEVLILLVVVGLMVFKP